MKEYKVIGLMSGTSMDGVDLAYCRFSKTDDRWHYEILQAVTYEYAGEWRDRLNNLFGASALDYASTHAAYGKYLGRLVRRFMNETDISEVDFVSSHGHTVFHQPNAGFTSQVGEGAALSAASGCMVICDFRTTDVAYGGQGAPLVPMGDRLLFPDYTFCLNLGGIANISYESQKRRVAFDVCPCNLLLNHFAGLAGKPFDKNGEMAASGSSNGNLMDKLNAIAYYKRQHPKSLGREDIENVFLPLLAKTSLPLSDILRTLVGHIAIQVASAVSSLSAKNSSMLLSGGGAFNAFLVEEIKKHTETRLEIPDAGMINYKEALIFAFLGVLRFRGEPNCLHSVTGASKDACGGTIYLS